MDDGLPNFTDEEIDLMRNLTNKAIELAQEEVAPGTDQISGHQIGMASLALRVASQQLLEAYADEF